MSAPSPAETAWRKAIADQVRRNCTPSHEAYTRGGDIMIAAVADWIENPPAWSAFEEPAPPPVPVDEPTVLTDYAAAEEYFADTTPEVIAARDTEGTLYLLSENEDGGFYIGIPMAEDEDGDIVDRHTGWLDPTRRTKGRYGPAFPLTVLGTGRMAMFVNGGKTLAEIAEEADQ